MPSYLVEQKLLAIAKHEAILASSRPGVMANSVLFPYLIAHVYFVRNPDIEDVLTGPLREAYQIFPKEGRPSLAKTLDAAAIVLFNSWIKEFVNMDQMQRTQAIQAIEWEFPRAAGALGGIVLHPMPPASARSSGGASIVGGIGCVLTVIVAFIIAVAIMWSLIIHASGGNASINSGNSTGGVSIDISSCLQQSGFDGNTGQPSAGADFSDVSFPDGSVSYFGDTFNDGSYQFQIVHVCTVNTSTDNVRSFYASSMPNNGWTQTDHFPYAGNPNRGCGDPYCWTQGSSPTRFASLESVTESGGDAVYELRLGTLP